jgi:hypothetical protein
MSPFTADAKIISEIFGPDNVLWKIFSGPVQSILISERKTSTANEGSYTQAFLLTVGGFLTSDEDISNTKNICEKKFSVTANWDFMTLKNVEVAPVID